MVEIPRDTNSITELSAEMAESLSKNEGLLLLRARMLVSHSR